MSDDCAPPPETAFDRRIREIVREELREARRDSAVERLAELQIRQLKQAEERDRALVSLGLLGATPGRWYPQGPY